MNKLSNAQQRAITHLLEDDSRTVKDAARKACVSITALTAWLADPDFIEALDQAKKDLDSQTRRRLTIFEIEAMEYLHGVITSEDIDAEIRLRAAAAILDRAKSSIPSVIESEVI